MPLAAQVQPLLAPLLLRAAREIATPWNATLTCDNGPNGYFRCTSPASTVLFRGSPTSTLLMTNDVCTVPHLGQLMLYVLLQALLTALWGIVAVGLERLIQRWRTRPKAWSASARTLGRTRARTRYDAEKEEVFFETKRGVIEPALHLERLASYTSDLDDVQIMPSSSRVPMCNYHGATNELDPNNPNEQECAVDPHRQLMLDILTTSTTVKFGWSLRVCIAALPTAFQFGIGLYLRTRPGGACPTTPRVAGWFGLFGGHSTLPTQVVVTLLALWPCRALAPFAALIAAGLQLIWNGSLLMTLAAVAGPMDTTATCFPARLFRLGRGVSWTVSSVFTEVITAGAATMFAMHVRPRASNPTPVSIGGLMLIALVLLAVQFARAAVVGFILPTRGGIGDSLHCAVDAGGQGAVYAFGRFAGLI